ncbi:MAG TPA: hypothetical protein VFU22_22370 [Roseiflexaceae bacterium]|nr:hypothetical protein [Roseiflexaceae bacterium]
MNVGDVMLAPGREGIRVRDPKNRTERIVILGPTATPRYTLHQLRHTHGRELIEQGYHKDIVQPVLGRRDPRSHPPPARH